MPRRRPPRAGFQPWKSPKRTHGPELYLVRDTRPPVMSAHERAMGYLVKTLLPSRDLDENDLTAEVARIYLEHCTFIDPADCDPGFTVEQHSVRLIDSAYGLGHETTPIQTQREVFRGVYLGKMAIANIAVSA